MQNKINIGTITFHGSHNYGSMLQAYALQEYIKQLFNGNCDYNIINFIPPVQNKIYNNIFDAETNWKTTIKRKIFSKEKQNLINKTQKFNNFKNSYLNLTDLYSSGEELRAANLDYDYYIAGSDQIWNYNTGMDDFDWPYLLNFTNSKNKVSYAVSMGPKEQLYSNDKHEKFKKYLNDFQTVTVRDAHTQKYLNDHFKINSKIMPDPCFLLTEKQWSNAFNLCKDNKSDDYIFLYHFNTTEATKLAAKIRKHTKLPIVISQIPGKFEYMHRFKTELDVGPIEFLSLIKNAKFVLTTSMHACIFSIIFNKNFYAINSSSDFRIDDLLTKYKLQDHEITIENYKNVLQNTQEINPEAYNVLNDEKSKAKKMLSEILKV